MIEHFIYGLFNNAGYKTIHTSQVKKILTKEGLQILQGLQLKKGQDNDIVVMEFPSENVITFTYLQSTNDVYGRKGVFNHTLIVRPLDFFHEFPELLEVATNLVKPYLIIAKPDKPPETLEPIRVETK